MRVVFQMSFLIILISGLLSVSACQSSKEKNSSKETVEIRKDKKAVITGEEKDTLKNYKVTFIELGSVRCIPCQQMQPVMKAIEEKYKDQVEVIFYDVWTPQGKIYADIYKINLIPVQVFLDEKGNEFYRHEGYFPLEEVEKVLKTKGVK